MLVNSCMLLLLCHTWLIKAVTVRPLILADLTNEVAEVVSEKIREQTTLLETAVENQRLVNEECADLEQQSRDSCLQCATDKCEEERSSCAAAANNVANTVIQSVKKKFKGWGRRELKQHQKKSDESHRRRFLISCNVFNSGGPVDCEEYADPSICPACVFDKASRCPGWSAANAATERLTAAAQWIEAADANSNIEITQMLYENADYDPATGGFSNTRVFIDMFGTSYTFTISESVDLINIVGTANLIATYVISAARIA